MGVELDEILVAPSGATGMAMWVNEDKPDQSASEFVIFADFQDDAGELNENIVDIIMNAVEDERTPSTRRTSARPPSSPSTNRRRGRAEDEGGESGKTTGDRATTGRTAA